MAQNYGPRIVQDGLVMCLDPSQNKSYPTTDLPIKDGLIMWMDAADDSVFSYSSGTTVSQWRDKSGFNYHMVPAAPLSTGPSRNTSLNSRKTLTFTTAQSIGSLTFTVETSANTVFVVSRLTGGSNGRVLTAYYNNWLLGHWGGLVNPYYAEGWVYYPPNSADTVWRMYMGEWGGPSNDVAAAYSNGTVLNFNTNQASAGPKGLGINYQSGEPSNCEAAEVIVFNRLLTPKERNLVHTYLGQKWGISNTDRSIIDLSGNDDNGLFGNGTVANMPDYDFYNKGALTFNGTSDYINLGNASSIRMGTGNFTISTWIKILTQTGTPTYKLIITSKNAAAAAAGYGFAWNNSVNKFLWSTANGSSSSEIFTTNTWSSLEGIWANVVMIRQNGATNNGHFYINGVYESLASAATVLNVDTATNMTVANTADLNGNYWFKGLYGSVCIYNRALSAAEVAQNYEAQKSKFTNTIVQQGLVLNLDAGNPFSYAGAGTTWYDVSGNSYNGTLTGGPVYSTDGGGAFLFSGNYSLSPVSTVNSLNGNNLTVEAWVKHNTFGGAGTGRSYISNWHSFNVSNQRGFILRTFDVQTYPTFWWCWGGANYFSAGPSSYVMQTGKIYHIVATYEKNVAMKIYINGNLEYTTSDYTSNTILFDTSNGLYVGFSNINSSYMDGNIYSARLYNRTLTAAEVLQNYNATKGRFGL